MGEIKTVNLKDEEYPKILRDIKNPPQIIYYRGMLPGNENCFAVVGARRCSNRGKQIAWEIAGDLSEAGLTIVSGLALGIDASSHLSAVKRKKRTIAVLGTGVDNESIYPKENLKLAEEILENGGCLMSECAPESRGTSIAFPQRNRIISGLSSGILVIEARERSGSLNAANWAKQQKRKIFAFSEETPHILNKYEAILIETANDILKELGLKQQ